MRNAQIADVVKAAFLRRLERPAFLMIAAQNLRLPACLDTLLQTDDVGIILKIEDLQAGDLHLRHKGGSMWYRNNAQPDKLEFVCKSYH